MDVVKLLTEKNVGGADRLVRVVLGVVFLALAYFLQQYDLWVRAILGLVGVIGLVTGLLSHCTIYSLFGWSTRKEEKPWRKRR